MKNFSELITNCSVVVCVICGLGSPQYKTKTNDIWLIIINSIAPNNLFTFSQLISHRLTLHKCYLDLHDRIGIFVEEFDSLYELIVSAHLNVLDIIVVSQVDLFFQWVELAKLWRSRPV